MGDYDYWGRWPAESRPREAKGGIRAQSKRGAFGQSWWAQRWMATLESFDIGARLARGRTYARKGQVLSVEVAKGVVRASVQGSRVRPYKVTMKVTPLSASEWERVAQALSEQAIFAAKLLAGEMPDEIEEVFATAGLSLFPNEEDLDSDCSCPDWSNPCKHIAAVYCLLGEEFDRDPFLLFRMRGAERDDLLAQLSAPAPSEAAAPVPPEPLSADARVFWHGALLPDDVLGEVRRPPVDAPLLRRLGSFPFWRGAEPPLDALASACSVASARGMSAHLGIPGPAARAAAGPASVDRRR